MPSPPKKRILSRRQDCPNPSLVSLPDTPTIKRTIKRKARSPSIEEDEDEEEDEPLIRRKKASAPIEKESDSHAKLGGVDTILPPVAPPNEIKNQILEESSPENTPTEDSTNETKNQTPEESSPERTPSEVSRSSSDEGNDPRYIELTPPEATTSSPPL